MGPVRTALAVAVAAAVTACSGSGPATSEGSHTASVPATYYLALGDSLSQGVQPDAAGTSVPTQQGYADQLYAVLHRSQPALQLVKLGCPGETTASMIHGGICRYRGGSQLADAVAFLSAHRGHVFLVTIDIGANDPEDCGLSSLRTIAACIGTDLPKTAGNLDTILARLRAAAGPNVKMTGMSYYLPALAEWLNGTVGQGVAWVSERLAAVYTDMLNRVYAQSGVRVADVFGAFETSNFGNRAAVPGIGTVPRNVALICQWTWACASPPRGPNQHANQAGYGVIARAFLSAAGLSSRGRAGRTGPAAG
jgi:lysophospholipase L1-like esterase